MRVLSLLVLSLAVVLGAEKYDGPKPPKQDVPYLLHADALVPTEVGQARDESKKDGTTYTIAGVSSAARTPLAEPIFILDSKSISPDRLALYKLDVKNGRREILIPARGKRSGPKPLRLTVTRLGGTLYKLEAAEQLENGEYSLSPDGANDVFCFSVY